MRFNGSFIDGWSCKMMIYEWKYHFCEFTLSCVRTCVSVMVPGKGASYELWTHKDMVNILWSITQNLNKNRT